MSVSRTKMKRGRGRPKKQQQPSHLKHQPPANMTTVPSGSSHPCPEKSFGCDSCANLNNTLNKLIDKITELGRTIADQGALITSQSNQLATQRDQIAALQNGVDATASVNPPFDRAAFDAWKNEIEERVEERTNRQMRKTLVFRGIPERAGEKTWQDTDELLAKTLADVCDDINHDEASDLIDRCHRQGDPKYYRDAARTRPVVAAMMNWKDCEHIITAFRSSNTGIRVDYKYGPRTTRRRNLALQHRMELKRKGELDQGYVKYPAKLMGKKRGDKEYKLVKDFSKIMV